MYAFETTQLLISLVEQSASYWDIFYQKKKSSFNNFCQPGTNKEVLDLCFGLFDDQGRMEC